MNLSIPYAGLAFLFAAISLSASETKRTDARIDGFVGPIRSVSATEEKTQLDWHPANAAVLPGGLWCHECEYDREGNRIRFGQLVEGEFRGDSSRITHDENGNVIEKVVENDEGEVHRREVLGPFGITLAEDFENGKLTYHSTWSYDGNGHITDYFWYDREGTVLARSERMTDATGNSKEEWDYGQDGKLTLHFVETTDPNKGTWAITTFNENGSVKLALNTEGTKVLSFWREPGEDLPFGSIFFMDRAGKTQESYRCHLGGGCDHIVTYFPDERSHNATRLEWHDPAGVLQLAADYEYGLDGYGNWTKQTIWLSTPDLGDHKLFQINRRILTYWDTPPPPPL
jgi:hypothetical protein